MRIADLQERQAFKENFDRDVAAKAAKEQAEVQAKAEAARKKVNVRRALATQASPDWTPPTVYKPTGEPAGEITAKINSAFEKFDETFVATDCNSQFVGEFLTSNISTSYPDMTDVDVWHDAARFIRETLAEYDYHPPETQTIPAPIETEESNPYSYGTRSWRAWERNRKTREARRQQYAENARQAEAIESEAQRDRREAREGAEKEYWEVFYKSFLQTGLTVQGRALPEEAQRDLYQKARAALSFLDLQNPERLRKFAIAEYGPNLDLDPVEERVMEIEIDDRQGNVSADDFAKRVGLRTTRSAASPGQVRG